MVLPFLFALVFLLLVFGLIIALAIYIPLLPLFIQAWVLQLFGVVNMGIALPAVTLVIALAIISRKFVVNGEYPSQKQTVWISIGLILLYAGSAKFGYVWEILQFKHHYHLNLDNPFFQSSCADYTTTCLTHDDQSPYPDQLLPAIGAEILWYGGIALSLYGTKSSDTVDPSNIMKTIASVVSNLRDELKDRL